MDRVQRFLIACVELGQRVGHVPLDAVPEQLGELAAGGVELGHAEVGGHALDGVGSAEGVLDAALVQGGVELVILGAVGELQHELLHERLAVQAADDVRIVAAHGGVALFQSHNNIPPACKDARPSLYLSGFMT